MMIASRTPVSNTAFKIAVLSLALSIFFALAEGYVRGPMYYHADRPEIEMMLQLWCYGLRNIAEVVLSSAVIVFVAARFFEARTVLTVGFDRIDASKVSLKGPGDDNIVWIGHRYGSKLEAESVAAAFESRMKESAMQ
jgi:hypothetical protein